MLHSRINSVIYWKPRFDVTISLLSAILLVSALPSTGADAKPSVTKGCEVRTQGDLVRLEGVYEAGGAPGTFVQIIDPQTGYSRTDIVTGPLEEQSGFDGAPWLRHDGILLPIDMAGVVADARARAFIMRKGWREPPMRKYMRKLSQSTPDGRSIDEVTVGVPGASPMTLWFDPADHNLTKAVIEGDGGPIEIRFANWREVGNTTIALRREERDATGQQTVFDARINVSQCRNPLVLSRPASRPHQTLAMPSLPVPFVFDHEDRGHIVVSALLNGRAARLVFDTGAANYFTPAVARSYGLMVGGGVNIGGVGTSSIVGGYTKVEKITIGAASLRDSVAMVAPLPEAATKPRPGLIIQGLTGFEFLSEFRTTIDYGHRTIEFTSFDEALPAGAALPFRTDGNSIFVEATVEGHRGWFRVDTGDGGSITLFKRFADTAGFGGDGERRVATGEVGGDLAYRDTAIRKVVLAGFSMTDVHAQVVDQDAGAFGSRTVAGNIGAGLLSRFRIVIDFRARRLVLTPSKPQA